MPIISWINDYSIGINDIDSQHQQLFTLFGKSYDAFVGLKEVLSKTAVLDELEKYALYHFTAEEELMRQHNYPALDNQIKEHKYFCNRVKEIKDSVASNQTNNALDLVGFLCDWLIHHITVEDKKIGEYLNKKL